jgi:hypothetical protein
MENSHQRYWFGLGGISFSFGLALVGAAVVLDAARTHFPFWTSPAMILAYAGFAVSFLALICGIQGVSFPLVVTKGRTSPADALFCRVPGDRRIFVNKTPKALTAQFKSYTSAQAIRLLEPHYLDRWLRVHGALGDVGDWTGSFSEVVFKRRLGRRPRIIMQFTDRFVFNDQLSMLRTLSHITVCGRIIEINARSITLTDCELESFHR